MPLALGVAGTFKPLPDAVVLADAVAVPDTGGPAGHAFTNLLQAMQTEAPHTGQGFAATPAAPTQAAAPQPTAPATITAKTTSTVLDTKQVVMTSRPDHPAQQVVATQPPEQAAAALQPVPIAATAAETPRPEQTAPQATETQQPDQPAVQAADTPRPAPPAPPVKPPVDAVTANQTAAEPAAVSHGRNKRGGDAPAEQPAPAAAPTPDPLPVPALPLPVPVESARTASQIHSPLEQPPEQNRPSEARPATGSSHTEHAATADAGQKAVQPAAIAEPLKTAAVADVHPVQPPASPVAQTPMAAMLEVPATVQAAPAARTDAPTRPPAVAQPETPAAQLTPALVSLTKAASGNPQMTVQLRPADLGSVQVRLERLPSGATHVDVTAEKADTLAGLQRDQPQLHRALDDAGVSPAGRTIAFHVAPPSQAASTGSGASGTGGGGYDANSSAGADGNPRGTPGRQGSVRSTSREPAEIEAQPAAAIRSYRAGLDITA